MVWWSTFRRQYQTVTCNTREFYIVKASIQYNESELAAFGCSEKIDFASDVSCHRLAARLQELQPYHAMPQFLTAYPNERGHCFIISVIIPLLNSPAFIDVLSEANFSLKMRYLRGESNTNSNLRFRTEVPNFWTDLFYKVYLTYRYVAFHPEPVSGLKLLDNGCIVDKAMLGHRFYPRRVKQVPAMKILDRSLFRNLVDSLARYCNKDYLDKAGDEREAYYHMLSKLSSEIPGLAANLFVKFRASYLCSTCSGMFCNMFATPYIHVSADSSLQKVLDCPNDVIMLQRFKSVHVNSFGGCCDHKIQRFMNACYVNTPKLLVFAVDGGDCNDMKIAPDSLFLSIEGVKFHYIHHASSVCFACYRSLSGVVYHPYEHGDERTEAHSYIYIRAGDGYYEANNGSIYTPDHRIFKKLMPGTLHYYHLSEYSTHIPNVRYDEVGFNPLF
uniref:Uncharacterized protein n=1 Tax=Tetranychus urticae TaxID=32264 RepID=T1KNF3_TETUR